MLESFKTLMKSKRFWITVAALAADIGLLLGLEPEQSQELVAAVTTLAGILVGGISISDHGKAMGNPAGVDHKG